MSSASREPVHFNAHRHTVLSYRPADGTGFTELSISRDLASIAFEDALPVRTVITWKGKNVYEGDYWSATDRKLVRHESFLERDCLIAEDFDRSVTAMSWQPFTLKWPKGTPGERAHTPDYFCRLRSGDGLVIDVKREDHVDRHERQFAMTREVCDAVGWKYRVFTGLPEVRTRNLTYLAGYRQDRFSPPPEVFPALLDAFTPETSFAASVRRAARSTSLHKSMVTAHVLHLLWTQELRADLDVTLQESSTVSVPVRSGR